jgi:hypothetical protein
MQVFKKLKNHDALCVSEKMNFLITNPVDIEKNQRLANIGIYFNELIFHFHNVLIINQQFRTLLITI